MSELLIQNTSVLQIAADGSSCSILENHDILVQGKYIQAVQPTGQVDASHFKQVIDGSYLLTMPGLINCHAHSPMVLFRGLAEDVNVAEWFNDYIWKLEHNLSEDAQDVYWGMKLGIAEMLRSGVTTVNEHYFFMDQAAQAVDEMGFRALLGWAIFSSAGEAMIERSADFATQWRGAADGRIQTIMAPHAPYTCTEDYLRACAFKAKQIGTGIHIHVSETDLQTQNSLKDFGRTPIEILEDTGVLDVPTVLAHACGALDRDITLLSRYQAGVAHCPKTYLKLAHEPAAVVKFREAGIPMGLGSDGAASNNTLNIFEALRLMAMEQKRQTEDSTRLPIPETLYIATREAAKVVGRGDELGSIEAGYLADMIMLDLSGLHHQPLHSVSASLVYNTEQSDVRHSIINGEVIMYNREILTANVDEIVYEANSRKNRMKRRGEANIQSYNP